MLNPDLLDAVRAEITDCERTLQKLRDIERLALDLTPAALPPAAPPVSPRQRAALPAPKPPRRTGGHNNKAAAEQRKTAILAVLATRGPLPPREIAEAIGVNVDMSTLSSTLAQLVKSGRLVGSGHTSSRTYDVARGGNGNANGSAKVNARALSPRVRKEEQREASGGRDEVELEDRIVEVIKHAGGRVQLSEIEHQLRVRHKHVEFDRGELERSANRLSVHGLVQRDAGGGLRLTRTVEEAALDAAGVESL